MAAILERPSWPVTSLELNRPVYWSDIGGTLIFHSICRVTRGDTVLGAVIFALWRFRNTGPGLESRT